MVRIEAEGVGVSFTQGAKRDDVQTLTYRALLRRPRTVFWALRDVRFRAEAGDVLGIIGRNGSGKTTLCRALSGLIRPDEGSLVVHGEVSALLSLGTGFDEDASGRENIVLNGLMLGLSRSAVHALVPAIIGFSGVSRFIDRPLKTYSSGMKARLGFSIAAMLEPDILLLDETLSVGDLEFTERAGEKLRELMHRASLAIVVSHQLEFVTKYCTRALWLEDGRVRAAGSADEVVGAYRDTVTPRARAAAGLEVSRPAPRSTRTPTIVARGVTVEYGRSPGRDGQPFRALDGVTFSLDEGEVLGVLGPNGAGKSTLCKVIAGVLRPDRGHIHVAGDVTALLTVGSGLNHQLSGADNVYLSGMLLGMSRDRVRGLFDGIVEFSELGVFIREPVKHYSRGMRARLAFSTATAVEPDTLIIDEALSAGDAAFSTKAASRIRELIARARAVVVVTHNLAFVEHVCTRALWLSGGTIRFDGEPSEAVRQYREDRGRQPAARTVTPSLGPSRHD